MTIQKNIQINYRKKLFRSLLCLVILLLLWSFSPFLEFFFPVQIPANHLSSRLNSDSRYASFEEITLHYTGYCYAPKEKTKGYYYYGFLDDSCILFLLKNTTCNDGQSALILKNVRGAVTPDSAAQEMLISNLAQDLEWDSGQLADITKPFLIVETEYHLITFILAYGLLFILTVLALLSTCLSVLYIVKPALSPFCGSLFKPEKSGRRLLRAEKELENYCLVRGEGFFISKHYLIELTKTTTHIFPLKSLAWVYEHHGLTSFFGHRKKVRYAITYYNKRKHAVHSVYKNHKDVDTILSYLRDYYPEILNGYTPENQELFKKL